jgi:hypothetical protein
MIIRYTRYKINNHLESLPLVSVRLATNKKHVNVWGLVDSGSDFCVFNSEIASILSVDIRAGKHFELFGFVGGSSNAWLHQVNLQLSEFPGVNINVAFTDSLMPELALLGQRGFFDNFQVRFLRFNNIIEIYPKGATI